MKSKSKGQSSAPCSRKLLKKLIKLKISKDSHTQLKRNKKPKNQKIFNAPHNTSQYLISQYQKYPEDDYEFEGICEGSMKSLIQHAYDIRNFKTSTVEDNSLIFMLWKQKKWRTFCHEMKPKMRKFGKISFSLFAEFLRELQKISY